MAILSNTGFYGFLSSCKKTISGYVSTFVSGTSGWIIKDNGETEFKSIYARDKIITNEYVYNRIRVTEDEEVITSNGKILSSFENEDGSWTVKLDLREGDLNPFWDGDLLQGYYHSPGNSGVIYAVQRMMVDGVNEDQTMIVKVLDGAKPYEYMIVVRVGNLIDPERQGFVKISSKDNNQLFFNNIDSFEALGNPDNVRLSLGRAQMGLVPSWAKKIIGNVANWFGLIADGVILKGTFVLNNGKTIVEYTDESVSLKIKASEDKLKTDIDKGVEANEYINTVLPGDMDSLQTQINDQTLEMWKMQDQIDGQVESWFLDYSPAMDNYPANSWTTVSERNRHVGDTFTNTQEYISDTETPDAGKSWRFVVNGSTYSWTPIADSDAVKALLAASKAQDTADGKRRTFVSQPIPPYNEGDLWAQGESGDLMRCVRERLTGVFSSADWDKASKYTDDSEVTGKLLDTGIDIVEKEITLTADKTKIRDNSGHTIALFEEGKLNADLINTKNLTVYGSIAEVPKVLDATEISWGKDLDFEEGFNWSIFHKKSSSLGVILNLPTDSKYAGVRSNIINPGYYENGILKGGDIEIEIAGGVPDTFRVNRKLVYGTSSYPVSIISLKIRLNGIAQLYAVSSGANRIHWYLMNPEDFYVNPDEDIIKTNNNTYEIIYRTGGVLDIKTQ